MGKDYRQNLFRLEEAFKRDLRIARDSLGGTSGGPSLEIEDMITKRQYKKSKKDSKSRE